MTFPQIDPLQRLICISLDMVTGISRSILKRHPLRMDSYHLFLFMEACLSLQETFLNMTEIIRGLLLFTGSPRLVPRELLSLCSSLTTSPDAF